MIDQTNQLDPRDIALHDFMEAYNEHVFNPLTRSQDARLMRGHTSLLSTIALDPPALHVVGTNPQGMRELLHARPLKDCPELCDALANLIIVALDELNDEAKQFWDTRIQSGEFAVAASVEEKPADEQVVKVLAVPLLPAGGPVVTFATVTVQRTDAALH